MQLMHQRAVAAGGCLTVEPATPHGTRVQLELPIPGDVL
jgi:signal transduction histidine kinase